MNDDSRTGVELVVETAAERTEASFDRRFHEARLLEREDQIDRAIEIYREL